MSSRSSYQQDTNYGNSKRFPHESRRDAHSHYASSRSSPPYRRRSPRQDHSRTPPPGSAMDSRRWDARRDRDDPQDRSDYSYGRSSPPRGYHQGGYRDRDREGYRSPRYDSRSRSRSRSPPRRNRSPYYGGAPSREVILEGIPVDMTDDDDWPLVGRCVGIQIRKELEQYHDVGTLEDVRVIRDKRTGLSRQFGFIRFADVQGSTAFLERNYPTIYLYGPASSDRDEQATKVRIAFSRERDDRDRREAEVEWRCRNCALPNFARRTECFRCQTPRTEVTSTGHLTHNKPSHFTNTGDSDAAPDSVPSQFLLIRGLEPTVSEELLAKGVAKLYKPSGGSSPATHDQTKKPANKIISTTSTANLGAQDGSIKRVLIVRDRHSDESWRYGFAEFHSVEDAQAAVVRFNALDKFTISSKPVIVSYIHAGVFVPVFSQPPNADKFTFTATSNPSLKLAYWDEEAYVSELVVSSTPPNAPDNVPQSSTNRTAQAVEKEGLLPAVKDAEPKAKKRKADSASATSNKKAVPSHLQFWRDRHVELHGGETASSTERDASSADEVPKTKAKPAAKEPPSSTVQSYADLVKKCCYLCSRQFKTEEEVNKHERLSQLHRDNLKNDELKAKALAKLGNAASPPAADTPEYRDRAKERRAAYNQPKKPSAGGTKPPVAPKAAVEEPEEEPAPAPSKGASLLGKMGWTAGKGLGAQGTGMVAPIATELYVQGVGLGAQGGKVGDAADEASRNTKGGYEAFLERTKDKAKERYESMS